MSPPRCDFDDLQATSTDPTPATTSTSTSNDVSTRLAPMTTQTMKADATRPPSSESNNNAAAAAAAATIINDGFCVNATATSSGVDLKLTNRTAAAAPTTTTFRSEGGKQSASVSWFIIESVFTGVMLVYFMSFWFWCFLPAYFAYRFFLTETGKRCITTLPRDLRGLRLLVTVKWKIYRALAQNRPLHSYFLDQVAKHPEKEAVVDIETGRKFTFNEFNTFSNKYANYFAAEDYSQKDVVALFVENSPEFFGLWLGLSKLGIVTAWINSNLKLEPLAHSIRVSHAKCIVTSPTLLPTLKKAMSEGFLDDSRKIYLTDGTAENCISVKDQLVDGSEPESPSDLNFHSKLCYIYTSGTTGNPKPAVIKHLRYFWMSMGSGEAFGLRTDDRIYVTMPMYHSAAGILGIGQVIIRGATVVIRRKFSASNFWKDCIAHKCTASQYIGEICRYLLAQKSSPEEKQHNVRLMFGNGLRAEIWTEFVNRFGIERIGELYGSTEGNSNILNIDNHVGACGFFPIYPFLSGLYPVRLLKIDPETGEIIRDANGLCVTCKPGDTGEMVGVIRENDPLLKFEGYVDSGDTQKKIIYDVVRKGDCVFSSGDILHWDRLGYLYFKDRRGDTYRWRGENVSTTEVEGVLQIIMSIEDVAVYGVEIPGREGRAGMVALTLAPGADVDTVLDEVASRLNDHLAAYAVPVFLRICTHVDKTGTFKLKKRVLQAQGFDLGTLDGDPVYYWDPTKKSFAPMDAQMQADIESGRYSKI